MLDLSSAARFLQGPALLGQLARMNGFITNAQLDEALAEQKRDGRPMGALLVTKRILTADQLAALLSQQKEMELPVPEGTVRRVGPYALTTKLGEGGAGVVWKAWDTRLQRWVAIKEPKAEGPTRERFLREARAAAKLRHPNLIEVFEVLHEEGRDYLVMRFVEGRSLDQAELGLRRSAEIVADLCDAVQHMHDHGVLHRDIKPQNILIDAQGRGCLGDFGLAKDLANAAFTAEGKILGTPLYMAPEQASGGTPVPATDVYALGATLYHAVAGRPPFDAEGGVQALFQKLMNDEPAPIAAAPRDLELVILKALRKEAGDRYASASAMAADLRRFLKGEPVEAKATPAAARWLRRNARVIGIALLVALLTVAWLSSMRSADRYRTLIDEGMELWTRATKGAPTVEQALARFTDAAALEPARPEPCVLAARCVALLGRDPEPLLSEALKRAPANGPALLDRSKLYAQRFIGRRVRPATRITAGRVTFGPSEPESAEERGWRLMSEADLEKARATPGLEPSELSYIAAALAFGAGRYGDAAAIEPAAWEATWLELHGIACYYANDVVRAERSLTAALAHRTLSRLHRTRGDVRICARRFADAVADYDAAGGDPLALCNRGIALTELGKTAQAIESITRAIAAQPIFARAYHARGVARANQAEFAEAQRDFETALEQNDYYTEAYNSLGSALFYQSRTEEAVRQFSIAIDMDPQYAAARVNRGIALRSAKRLDEAVADFDAAARIEETPETLAELGLTLRVRGDPRAAGVLRRALEIAPPDWPRADAIRAIFK